MSPKAQNFEALCQKFDRMMISQYVLENIPKSTPCHEIKTNLNLKAKRNRYQISSKR